MKTKMKTEYTKETKSAPFGRLEHYALHVVPYNTINAQSDNNL